MTDRDAFTRAICEDPGDDTTRLVFADWLEDNGEPERAAYIRNRVANPARTESFVGQHDSTGWFSGTHVAGASFVVSRGFVSEIHLPCAQFVADGFAKELFRAHPIERVVLTNKTPLRRLRENGDEEWGWCFAPVFTRYDLPHHWLSFARGREWAKGWRVHDTEAEAVDDLSHMASASARNHAGLPAWEPEHREAV